MASLSVIHQLTSDQWRTVPSICIDKDGTLQFNGQSLLERVGDLIIENWFSEAVTIIFSTRDSLEESYVLRGKVEMEKPKDIILQKKILTALKILVPTVSKS